MAAWLTAMILMAGEARAEDGWRCTAQAAWSLCARSPDQCTSHAVHVDSAATSRDEAEDDAVQSCRLELGESRLTTAFLVAAEEPASAITRVDTPCAVEACEPTTVQPDLQADAFDEPVCIEVRRFVCTLCGADSALCTQVQTEQPVTADACSQTHARLATFSDLLGQVDSVQPGSWTDARRELCGIP